MFAFALWSNDQLILARDPVGIKPLMRTIVDDTLVFASEAKALRAHEAYVPEIDTLAMKARIAWEYPLDATTLFADVYQVRPGTVEVWELIDGIPKMTSSSRFEIQKVEPTIDWNDPAGLLKSFTLSVSDRLMSDVPVGVVLSGGLDSSLIAALSKQVSDSKGAQSPDVWTVAGDENNPDMKAAIQVAETASFATISITRTNGYTGIVEMNYETTPLTAKEGIDYLPIQGSVVFADSENIKYFDIPIIDNDTVGNNLT